MPSIWPISNDHVIRQIALSIIAMSVSTDLSDLLSGNEYSFIKKYTVSTLTIPFEVPICSFI